MKLNNIYTGYLLMALSLAGCVDTLDVDREDAFSDTAIWQKESTADMYVTASYKIFYDDAQLLNNRSKFWDAYSDLVKSSSWSSYGHMYNMNLLQSTRITSDGAGPFECWSNEYTRIKRANVCINDLKQYGQKFGEEFMSTRMAEIRLCRAFSYFRLARVYGGVVKRLDNTGVNGGISDGAYPEDVPAPRMTEAETYRFILDELYAAAKDLPDQNDDVNWKLGRATKGFAYGLISRIALYAGEWKEAAEAAEKVAEYGYRLVSDYSSLFSPFEPLKIPEEYLFVIRYQKELSTHMYDCYVAPFTDSSQFTGGELQPTAELADLYEWSNGKAFSWDTWEADCGGTNSPFENREPRFQATILYNGSKWKGRTIEPYVGGADGFTEFITSGATGGHSCTGYYIKKHLDESNTSYETAQCYSPDPVMRYAEVLLNKAEAYAMLDFEANKSKVLAAVNEVRARVKLPAKTSAEITDLTTCMKLIREERAKELACEGFRVWDLRRWKIASETLNGKARHGVKITKAGTGFHYQHIEVDAGLTMYFPEKYNYFSIPVGERSNNPLCTNNPMW